MYLTGSIAEIQAQGNARIALQRAAKPVHDAPQSSGAVHSNVSQPDRARQGSNHVGTTLLMSPKPTEIQRDVKQPANSYSQICQSSGTEQDVRPSLCLVSWTLKVLPPRLHITSIDCCAGSLLEQLSCIHWLLQPRIRLVVRYVQKLAIEDDARSALHPLIGSSFWPQLHSPLRFQPVFPKFLLCIARPSREGLLIGCWGLI